jgi:hypothetical protein
MRFEKATVDEADRSLSLVFGLSSPPFVPRVLPAEDGGWPRQIPRRSNGLRLAALIACFGAERPAIHSTDRLSRLWGREISQRSEEHGRAAEWRRERRRERGTRWKQGWTDGWAAGWTAYTRIV